MGVCSEGAVNGLGIVMCMGDEASLVSMFTRPWSLIGVPHCLDPETLLCLHFLECQQKTCHLAELLRRD